jgi:hemerythrin-like domain-containing protein
MSNIFKNIFNSNAHTLEDIRQGLVDALDGRVGLIHLIKKHHDFLEESIATLTSKEATDMEKQTHLFRFFRLMEMHGKAEEEVLYTELRRSSVKEARLAGYAAQDEHDVTFRLEEELLEMGYRDTWNEEIQAKGKVAAGLVQYHLRLEENEIFPLAEKVIPVATMENMVKTYITKCLNYLDDSKTTSKDHPVTRMRPTDSWGTPNFLS